MMKTLRKGQTMVEYIIIVVLIAVSLIAVFTFLSRAIGKKAAGATEALPAAGGVIPCGVFAEGRRWSRRFSPS